MSQIHFFQSPITSLQHVKLGRVFVAEQKLVIEADGKGCGFDYLFQIAPKIIRNAGEIQSRDQVETVKQQLEQFKGRLIEKLKSDRGFLGKMEDQELQLLEAYFTQVGAILDTRVKGTVRRVLEGAFKVGILGSIVYGGYCLFPSVDLIG